MRKQQQKYSDIFAFAPSPRMQVSDGVIHLKGTIRVDDAPVPLRPQDLCVYINDKRYEIAARPSIPADAAATGFRMRVDVAIPLEDVYDFPIHSAVLIGVMNAGEGAEDEGPEGAATAEDAAEGANRALAERYHIRYKRHAKHYLARHTRYYFDTTDDLTVFFRQAAGKRGGLMLTVRHANTTDRAINNVKLYAAWALSHFWIGQHNILLFEKNCAHYEESAATVFEELVDRGYKNVRFILNEQTLAAANIDEKYRPYIIKQHSFSHYLNFFAAHTFIGTEALAHGLELRCQNVFVQRRLKSKKIAFVFLQHGVMYMISLNSPARTSFLKRNMPKNTCVVVSSEAEATHFVEYAGFDRDDIIVCGLPKFDRSYQHASADKILVMPTWRIWEFNEMRRCASETKYVQMVKRIVGAVPEELRDKVVVAYHPLFTSGIFHTGLGVGGEHAAPAASVQAPLNYDELLRDVALLITDYSSIAYDAYYRGANVIFYWEERDECLEHYGEGTYLLLNESNAFGPACYNKQELTAAIEARYGKPQEAAELNNYHHIVEFHDDQNTARLISALQETGIL